MFDVFLSKGVLVDVLEEKAEILKPKVVSSKVYDVTNADIVVEIIG
jgi:hypothetical protein